MVSTIIAGKWGDDDVTFGSGSLHFKAKLNNTSAFREILVHPVNSDDFVNVGEIKNISITKMTDVDFAIKEPPADKYDINYSRWL